MIYDKLEAIVTGDSDDMKALQEEMVEEVSDMMPNSTCRIKPHKLPAGIDFPPDRLRLPRAVSRTLTAAKNATGPAMTTNQEFEQRRDDSVARAIAYSSTFTAKHASNSEVWDVEGKRYIDFCGGIGCQNVATGMSAS